MDFVEFKKLHLEKIDFYLNKIFEEKKLTLNKELSELIEEVKNFSLRPGKRIRPLLFILGYEAYKENEELTEEQLYSIAASLEIMHAFLLIHDDIMDRATMRRGAPTLHLSLNAKYMNIVNNKKIGEDLSIVLGDLLFFYVLNVISKINIPNFRDFLEAFSECYISTAYGQLLDSLYSLRKKQRIKGMSFEIAKLKTAYYSFYYPFYLGYLATNSASNLEEIETIKKAIIPAGIAFQIRDDIISVFDKSSGKTNTADIMEGKYTSLIDLGDYDKSFFSIFIKSEKTSEEIQFLIESIKKSKAYDRALEKMNKLFDESLEKIEDLKIDEEYKQLLREIINTLRSI
ncbi:polyprenyl synthetase family protein [Thermosipho atlanticus]|uniref:Geranylgeranyl diphosphate synthase, type I n=1 Tax=Thermosipho atlanticus DSM 15807 TaxID=1123380 RepID=A0A1M5QYK1_9BACT|nr:polyprenyl synthetase family protein [Thermosipho atlanticus]SHH18789.1 geranylgeranyl diphosphate synthase, type I [Thermosipho atlanticus DSM 15807]